MAGAEQAGNKVSEQSNPPAIEMEELTIQEVQKFLKEHPHGLLSTHKKVSFPILKRIHEKLQNGERFGAIHIADNIIVDGHHRYICYSILNIEINKTEWLRSRSVDIFKWHDMEVEMADWDYPYRK